MHIREILICGSIIVSMLFAPISHAQITTDTNEMPGSSQQTAKVPKSVGAKQDPTISALIAALKDKKAAVREKAAWSLGTIGDKKAIPPLINALRDKVEDVRMVAAESLKKFGKTAVKPLIAVLKNKNARAFAKANAAEVLGHLKDERAIRVLSWTLKHDRNSKVREAAAEAIGEIKGKTEYAYGLED